MLGNMSGPTLLVILFIVLLLFGAPKLPGLAKSLGQSMRILKKEVRSDNAEAKETAEGSVDSDSTTPAAPANPAASATGADETTPRKPADEGGSERA